VTTAVLDTNVLASGFVGRFVEQSTPGELIRQWVRSRYVLAVSEYILLELARAFQQPYFTACFSAEDRAGALLLLREEAHISSPTASVSGVATHPEDDLALATALSARADYLVTGDERLRRRMTLGTAIAMPERRIVRIQAEGQVMLPADECRQLGLKKGDLVTVVATPEGALIAPQELVAQKALDRIGDALRAKGLSPDEPIESGREERTKLIEERYGIKGPARPERRPPRYSSA
jgi:putative PIN family toxin of toxin-antitoxin system